LKKYYKLELEILNNKGKVIYKKCYFSLSDLYRDCNDKIISGFPISYSTFYFILNYQNNDIKPKRNPGKFIQYLMNIIKIKEINNVVIFQPPRQIIKTCYKFPKLN
jgi:hypothetical protein